MANKKPLTVDMVANIKNLSELQSTVIQFGGSIREAFTEAFTQEEKINKLDEQVASVQKSINIASQMRLDALQNALKKRNELKEQGRKLSAEERNNIKQEIEELKNSYEQVTDIQNKLKGISEDANKKIEIAQYLKANLVELSKEEVDAAELYNEKVSAREALHKKNIEVIIAQRRENSKLLKLSTKIRESWELFAAKNPISASILKWTSGFLSLGSAIAFVKGAIIDNAKAIGELQKTTAQLFTNTGDPSAIAIEWRNAALDIQLSNGLIDPEFITDTFSTFAKEGITAVDVSKKYIKAIGEMSIFNGEAATAMVPFIAEMEKTGRNIGDLDEALGAINFGFVGMQAEANETIARFTRLGTSFNRVAIGASGLNRGLVELGINAKTAGEFTTSLLQTSVSKLPKAFQHLFFEIKKGNFKGVAEELGVVRDMARDALAVGDLSSLAQQTGLGEEFLEQLATSKKSITELTNEMEENSKKQKLNEQATKANAAVFNQLSQVFSKVSAIIGRAFLPILEIVQTKLEGFFSNEEKVKTFEKTVISIGGGIIDFFVGVYDAIKLISAPLRWFFGLFSDSSGGKIIATVISLAGAWKLLGFAFGSVTKLFKPLSKGIGIIGKGIGKAIGGLLTGMSTGIASLGVALTTAAPGFLAFGGTVALVGAGIMAAGKGVEFLAKGIKIAIDTIMNALSKFEASKSFGFIERMFDLVESAGNIGLKIAAKVFGVDETATPAAPTRGESANSVLAPVSSTTPSPTEISNMNQEQLLKAIALLGRQQVEILANQNEILQRNADLKDLSRKRGQVGDRKT